MPADTKDPLLRSTLRLPELLFQAMEDAEVGVVILEAEHGGCSVVYVNEAFERITGADVGSSPGKPCRLVEPHGDERSASTAVRRVLATGEPCHVEFPTTLTDGRKAWIRFALSPITGTRGGTAQLLGLVQDITAAKVAQAQLEQSEYELRTIMTSVEEGIQLWDEEGRLIYANPASERQLGMVGGETDWGDGQQFVREDGTAVAHDDLPVHRALRTGQAQMEAMLHSNLDAGESKWIRMRAYPIRDSDSGRLRGAVTTTVDVTGNVEQEQRLARLAHYDALTQLPNRVLLSDRMRQAVARSQRTREVFAVGVMDLDGFKPVNDIYGHKAGDDVLCEVAQRVLGCLREGDTVARLGGDEFALLLTGLGSSKDSEWVLQRILAAVSAPYLVEGDVLKLSTSIGVTVYPGDLSDSDKLLRHADHAMYQAKQAGKNRIMFFDSTLETRFQANQGALRKISDALAKNQFELHYQPIVDCLQGRIVATEALIRWRHPVLGLLQPAEFLPLIEQDDLVIALGEWTISAALAQFGQWRRQGLSIDTRVNIAARQLHQPDFVARLREAVAKAEPDASGWLGIEVVETAALEDVSSVSSLIGELREAGIHIALDDFGTGYSSLIHLRRMPVDSLKIDQGFIHDMLDDPRDLAIVEGIVGLAQAFRCRVVAEGVETIDHILALLELGCSHIQGHAIAKPMTAAAFFDWAKAFRPDPLWRLATSSRPGRGDFQLLLAEANLRHWLDRLIASAQDSAIPAPTMDDRQCRFGHWYHGEGKEQYGYRPEYEALGKLHRQAHDLGERLLAAADGSEEKAVLLDQVIAIRDRIVAGLKALRLPSPQDHEWL